MKFINCTPHEINLNNGEAFPVGESIARVESSYTELDENLVCSQKFGDIQGLPAPIQGVSYIVSGFVLAAAKLVGRLDCVAPLTAHPLTVRNDKGHIVSVPGFTD